MAAYDFVIAGGGLAGLSLACHMVRSPLCGASILIIDRRAAPNHDRLWSYWTDQPTLFDPVVEHAWSQLHIASPNYARTVDLSGYRYELIRGIELDRFARRELALHANVHFRSGKVEAIVDEPDGARVYIEGEAIRAGWVFDSTHWPANRQRSTGCLAMHFKGWTLETSQPAFNAQAATFLDTRTSQQAGLRFFYCLPYSDREALVEYVVYGEAPPTPGEAQAALHHYMCATLGVADYKIVSEEAGYLPIRSTYHTRRRGRHHLAIGARAGLIKPTTGFAFRRIQQDAAAIVRSLLQTGRPWKLPAVSRRHRLYDALLLDVLARPGHALPGIFDALFEHNSVKQVLRFLDEATTPAEDLALIGTLPSGPFLRVVFRRAILGSP
jgi:lycopene beta-cyclase